METYTELTSNTPSDTQETIESSELNADEAAAITQSMDMSIAFWGQSLDPPEKISASRLKCGSQSTGKAASAALKIWEKMTQEDLERVKEIEIALMTEGEIGTIDLLHGIKSIIEGIGLEFEEILKSVDIDPLESTIAITNQILHIFNQNEPPEILEEDEFASFLNYHPSYSITKRMEKQNREITTKIKYLLNKAQRLGFRDIKVPSSPYLSERSKLSLIERQLKAKIKVRNAQQALEKTEPLDPVNCHSIDEPKYSQSLRYAEQRISTQPKRETRRSSLADRPKFRTAVKAKSLRYENLIKHAPDLSKRMKRVHEIRKKFLEKNKNNRGSKNSHNVLKPQSHHFASPLSFNTYKPRKRFHLSSNSNCCLSNYDSEESGTKINITIESNDAVKMDSNRFCQTPQFNKFQAPFKHEPSSREDMLLEMKKMLKEAVQEVSMSNTLNHHCRILEDKKSRDMKNSQTLKDIENNNIVEFETDYKKEDATNLDSTEQKQTEDDTVVTVTQEAGTLPFRQMTNKEENAVSTEVMVSKANGGQVLKVSVVSKLSGHDSNIDDLYRPRSNQKHIQEAIDVLKEYVSLTNKENIIPEETDECKKETGLHSSLDNDGNLEEIGSLISQTVASTEITIEPNCDDDEEQEQVTLAEEDSKSVLENDITNDDLATVQAFTVAMFMPTEAANEMQSFTPFQFGAAVLNQQPYSMWMSDEVDDIGDSGWSPWNSPIWHNNGEDDGYFPRIRNESDSLYVNTSEERIFEILGGGESSSFLTQMSSSDTSILAVARKDEEDSRRKFMARTVLLFYKVFINSVVGVLGVALKPFSHMKSFWTTNSNGVNQQV